MSKNEEKAAFVKAAEAMYEELRAWREAHPEASFDEIASQVTPQRRELMGGLLEVLAKAEGDGKYTEASCAECGGEMEASGRRKRRIVHAEGETEIERAYYHCAECGKGFFPPGPTAGSERTCTDTEDH